MGKTDEKCRMCVGYTNLEYYTHTECVDFSRYREQDPEIARLEDEADGRSYMRHTRERARWGED